MLRFILSYGLSLATWRTVHTSFHMERFGLSQLWISRAVTWLRSMLGVNLPFKFGRQKQFSHPLKARKFHRHSHLGKQLGCCCSLYSSQLVQGSALLKEAVHLGLHTRSSSRPTPTFIMCLLLCTTQRMPSSTTSFMERFSLSQVCIFKAGTLWGPFELCWQNTALTL